MSMCGWLIVVVLVSHAVYLASVWRHGYWVRRYEETYRAWHAHDEEIISRLGER